MDFRILGPFEVIDDGRTLDLGAAKQRAALAMLALHANHVVPHERLIDAVWAEEPPETAKKALQVYVSRLRKLLGREHLETTPRGYLLRLGPEELDLNRFELLRDGGDPARALALWRGDPLADFVDQRFAEAEIVRLMELRLSCLEQRIELDLADGRHAELVGELDALVHEHPLREHLRAQLMLALYRAGRQAEALEAYQAARAALVDGLGIEPGPALRELHQQILTQDRALDVQAPKRPARAELGPAPAPGRAEPRAAMAESRKTVTVLFCDLADSTELGERLDPELLRGLMARWYGSMREPLDRHGGTVEKFIGDAVMAVFGVPFAHEDDALRAVRAAVEMREALNRLNEELAGERRPQLRIRIGVNSGEVVTGDYTTTLVTGDAVNVAKRLEEAAGPDEILIGEQTRRLVENAALLETSAPVEAKGKRKAVEAWRVLGTIEGAASFARRTDTPIVDRVVERARLLATYEEAVTGRSCRMLTVLGVAGIGKSRLVAELLSSAAGQATVLVGRCLPYGEGITFWPVVELVRAAGGVDAVEAVLDDKDDRAAAAALRGLLEPGAVSVSSSDEIFWATRRLLETLALERPLIVCVEDIHWAEPTLLDLLEYLVGFIRDAPVLLLCLARPELAERRPAWLMGSVVQVEPLSEQDSEMLLDGLGDFGPEARRRIREAAEGNPLFAEQLAAFARDGGASVMPPTIQALLAERLDRLEPVERAVLEHASVVGREFLGGDVVALAPAELQQAVVTTLLSLTRKGLIRPDESAGPRDGFRFHHILIRDAAYDGMPKAARAALHERLADLLECAERRSELEEIVGYHLEQAYRCRIDLGSVDEALRSLGARASQQLELVGRRALTRSDLHAAIDLLERAASLSADDGARRATLLSEIGAAMIESGRLSEAERVLGEATTVAAEAGDPCAESRALVQQQFLKLLQVTEGDAAETARVVQRVVPIFERSDDDHGLCNAYRLDAFLHWNDAHAAAAAEAWERAAGHARRAGDERRRAEILTWVASAHCFGPTPVVEGIRRCEEIRSEVSGQLESEALTLRHLASLQAMSGRFELARSLLTTSNAVFEDLGLTLNAATSPNEAFIEMLVDDPAAAETSLRSGFDALTEIGEQSFLSTIAALLARTVFAQERLDEAEELARLSAQLTASGDVVTQALWRGVQARILARRGRLEEAEALAREAVSIVDQTDFLLYRGDALVDLAHILHDGGRAEDAATAAAAGLHFHEQKGNLVTSRKIRTNLGVLL